MKKILSTLLMISALAAIALTGCQPNEKGGDFSSKITGISPATVDITFTAPSGAVSYAVVANAADAEVPADEVIIFATAEEITLAAEENVAKITGLKAMTDYTAYFAFKTATGFYGKLFPVSFTTTDYTETVTITNVTAKGFSMHLEPTEEMAEVNSDSDPDNDRVLRYSFSDFAYYNMIRNDFPTPVCDASLLAVYDYPEYDELKNFTKEAIDLTYNDENLYLLDENGEIIFDNTDPDYPTPIALHREMVPGEPVVVYVGEFQWGEGTYADPGYYTALFDYKAWIDEVDKAILPTDVDESIFWTGFYSRQIVNTTPPTVLDATLDIEVEVKPTSGVARVTPGEGIEKYCVWIMDNSFYQLLLERYLDGHEEYMQWLTTSYTAYENWGMFPVNHGDPMEFDLPKYSVTGLMPETDYHIFAVGIGDAQGTSQVFVHKEFSTPEKVLPIPVVNVTPIDTEDPYSVAFNVKAPQKDLVYLKYVTNYDFEFVNLLNAGLSFNDIVSQMGSTLSDPNWIAAINSDEGATFEFSSRDAATTYFAVLGYNEEYSFNIIDFKDGEDPAVGQYTTPVDAAERVESELFSALEGDWTATYKTSVVNSDGSIKPDNDTVYTAKVSIYDGIPYPAGLSAEDYKVYEAAGYNKEQADKFYEEFKEEADAYNDKVRSKNQLACLGLGIGDLETITPYELFVHPTAGRSTISSVMYAFGPKWFLEIDANGNVSVPMNYSKMEPATAWEYDTPFYLCGVGNGYIHENPDKASNGFFNFPVEISEDKNTITIKPVEISGDKYYMTLGYVFSGTTNWAFPSNRIISTDIVLTRGYDAPEKETSAFGVMNSASSVAPANCVESIEVKVKPIVLTRTPISEPVIYKKAGERDGFWK